MSGTYLSENLTNRTIKKSLAIDLKQKTGVLNHQSSKFDLRFDNNNYPGAAHVARVPGFAVFLNTPPWVPVM